MIRENILVYRTTVNGVVRQKTGDGRPKTINDRDGLLTGAIRVNLAINIWRPAVKFSCWSGECKTSWLRSVLFAERPERKGKGQQDR